LHCSPRWWGADDYCNFVVGLLGRAFAALNRKEILGGEK